MNNFTRVPMNNFTVLMSVYYQDNPQFLNESLDSVFNQTIIPSEVIIIINGQIGPKLRQIVNLHKNKYLNIITILELKENIGLGPALNLGLKICKNELVARMDADDISKPNRFEKELQEFSNDSELVVVSSWIDEFENIPEKIMATRKLPATNKDIIRYSKRRCPVNHPAVMFKKSKIINVGGYELLGTLDDYILWMKLLKNGYKFYNIQESLLFFRAKNMYERRGGISYACADFKLQCKLYSMHTINLFIALTNMLIRCTIRLVPNKLRKFFYKYIRQDHK